MTDIRPELSKKNKYWLERHRYYELKHFCLQYSLWRGIVNSIDGIQGVNFSGRIFSKNISNPTVSAVERREEYLDKMYMVEKTAEETSPELSNYILKAVTEGRSYENMRFYLQMPVCKDGYYEFYRKFFYILDKTRK